MTITKEQIEAARKAAPVHLGPALDSTIAAVGEAMLGVRKKAAKTMTVDDVERIILDTEPRQLSDRGDKIWTRRMAVALAERFNSMLSATHQPAPQPVAVKPLEWHRADGSMSTLLYTLRQDGWRKGEPVMVNDVMVRIEKSPKSETDLEPIIASILSTLKGDA